MAPAAVAAAVAAGAQQPQQGSASYPMASLYVGDLTADVTEVHTNSTRSGHFVTNYTCQNLKNKENWKLLYN